MIRFFLGLSLSLFCFWRAHAAQNSISEIYLGSREGDPAGIVENVDVIHGNYTEIEIDLTVTAPDSLILSRFYSSRDPLQIGSFGGWRFNPHCFLTVQKDPKESRDGNLEQTYVYIGNPDGSILTYMGWRNTTTPMEPVLFKVGETSGLANTAKGEISGWTNVKNNVLYFNPQNSSFELVLSSQGRRFYIKHPSIDAYCITHEILPSGNKVFYEFDPNGRLEFIKETNASEKKVLAWIKIQYGNEIRVETSDGKTAIYEFQEDTSGAQLLTDVTRSNKPNLHYEYQVLDKQALLVKKTLPEGRFVQVNYYTDGANRHRVKTVIAPANLSGTATTQFTYGDHCAEVEGPENRKAIYRFDEAHRLSAIEQYLKGALYRVHRKSWNGGNLTSTSVEDSGGNIFYYQTFIYDSKDQGDVVEIREYGDLTGNGSVPLQIDPTQLSANQDAHIKKFSYFSGKNTHGFFQRDLTGAGVKYWYKKGTNLLIKKFILTQGSPDSEEEDDQSGITQRYFYRYNEDTSLIQVVVDDGNEEDLEDSYWVKERRITDISPKQELPNVGAPEIVEQKYTSFIDKMEVLLKRVVNQFDEYGNAILQSIYDANEKYSYSLSKGYTHGLLVFEIDPIGNKTEYSYDANQNLTKITRSDTGISIEYGYGLRNLLIYTIEKDWAGNQFKTEVFYDLAGYKIAEIDRLGNETRYVNDSLGRPICITYPPSNEGFSLSYTYSYDLFDNPISVTDPKERVLSRSYNVKGKLAEINYLDGTRELFRYDSGGNLHHHYRRNSFLEVFEYESMGRIERIQYYETSDKRSRHPLKEKTFHYDTFHKMSEISEWQDKTIYIYDESGRPASSRKENQKIEFIYDALGRVHGVKKWKSSNAFTLEIKEYDLLDRVIEERTENENGRVLLKKKYVYNDAGQLFQVIGYPQNQESILAQYEYDGFGRLSKTENGVGSTAQIFYDDFYINEWGQKGQKRILIDPLGNSREEIFDNEGNLVKTSQKDSSGQLLSCVETSCDFSRNKIYERAAVIGATALAKNYETEWSFNQKDQLESITLALDTPEEYFTRFKYNSDGELKAQYLPDSKEPISFRYNSDGNVESVFYKEGQKEVEFELYYDLHQNLAKIKKDDFHWVDYRFNAHDLLACETIQDEFGPYQINCTYDGEGKLQTLHFPDQSFVEYSYEGPFVKSATRFSEKKKELYTYEVASRDLMGNILEEILPGALGKKKQRWDKAGRRVEITADLFQTQVLDYDSLDLLKKKETALGQKKYPTDYDYNALHQLIFEKGEIKHQYSYDSLGNRLQKDASIYTVNEINQLVDTGIASYTFLPGGNIATKTIDAHTWTYQSNPLNQIVSIEDPDQNTISFTYDLTGKRLSKRIDAKDKKAKTFRFFYLGNTEIGCLDEEGEIVELKIPSDPNHPEAPCIAIEIKQEIYVPLHDLQGNIARLFDYKTGKLIENYRYSAFGEEEITNEMGLRISESTISNPWRYRGKRVDQEIGLIYFGKRYYDPEIGRWISPDPIGAIDGPNLYAFVHNNPIKYVDYFGLSSTIDTNCDCTQHHHPGWHYADRDCVCICGRNGALVRYPGKIGIELASILGGIGHGVVDFMISSLHDLQMMAAYIGSEELEMSLRERMGIIEAVEQSQVHRIDAVESLVMDLLSIDSSDMDYQSFRSKTILGLEIGSMIAGGYGLVKGAIGLGRLVRGTIRASRVVKSVGEIESFVNRGTSFAGSKRAPFEYAPYQKIRNKSAIINGREYSGHSLDRMQDRGFMPSFIESTLETGRVSPAEFPGELEYYDSINRVKVIVGRNRQIVTVIPGRG